eukprot:IDg22999t1
MSISRCGSSTPGYTNSLSELVVSLLVSLGTSETVTTSLPYSRRCTGCARCCFLLIDKVGLWCRKRSSAGRRSSALILCATNTSKRANVNVAF